MSVIIEVMQIPYFNSPDIYVGGKEVYPATEGL